MPRKEKLAAVKDLRCCCSAPFTAQVYKQESSRWCISCNADAIELGGRFFACETKGCQQELCLDCAAMFALSQQ
eukprot:2384630-Rhodomonas_salina.1